MIHAVNLSERVLRPLFSLTEQGFKAFHGLYELVVFVRWDRNFGEVLEQDFNITTSHRTRQITTSLWGWRACEP